MNPEIPIVFCHGLLGWGDDELYNHPYFVCAKELKEEKGDSLPPFLFPTTGPVSSLHDQACELFFQLKGGLTDYGAEHSAHFGHNRYSRFYGDKSAFRPEPGRKYGGKALYSAWDKQHPLDFVGHSMGAPTIRMLQHLLAEDFFYNCCGFPEHTDASWMHSVTSIAGVQNGSQLTWFLGADVNTGILKSDAFTVLFLCTMMNIVGKKQSHRRGHTFVFDLHLDQWNFDETQKPSLSLKALASKNAVFYRSEEWAMYDLTPNAMEKNNAFMVEYPDTWYFSYKTRVTFSLLGLVELFIPFVCHLLLTVSALVIGNYHTLNKKWRKVIRKWHHNDGMCPVEGQRFPYLGRESVQHTKSGRNERKGVWIEQKWPMCMDHAEIAMMPHWCRKNDEKRIYEAMVNKIVSTR